MNGVLFHTTGGISDLATVALRALKRLRAGEPLDQEEDFAVERLCSWLSRVEASSGGEEVPGNLEHLLDESQRAYLLSFRARSDSARRQYILPKRSCKEEAEACSRSSTDDAEALNDPELQEQLQLVEDWDRFDVFKVARLTDGRPLQTVGLNLLRKRGLIGKLQLAEDRLAAFLQAAEQEYHPNPYHSSLHAADVTQALAAMLAADDLARQLTDLELLALLLAAMIHDLGHPGVTNDFLVRTSSEAALQYNDQSINENMHLACAFKLLAKEECNFTCRLKEEDYRDLRRLVIKIVLATDMAVHKDVVDEFKAHVGLFGADLTAWPPEKRVLALQMLMHSADISNPARPLSQCKHWGRQVHEELFLQGDKERSLGLAVSPACDRGKSSVARNQHAFILYVMKPSFTLLAELTPTFVASVMPNIDASLQFWQAQLEAAGGAAAWEGHACCAR